MESPRGINDPCLGAFAPILAQADCILLLGKRLDFTLAFGKAPAFDPRCTFVQVDPDALELDRTRRALGDRICTSAVADVAAAIDALAALARPNARNAAAQTDWLDEVRAALAYRPSAWPDVGHPDAKAA